MNKQAIDPGPGYRLLKPNEKIQRYDTYWGSDNPGWVNTIMPGYTPMDLNLTYRRKIEHWWPGKDCKPAESPVPTSVSWSETPAKASVLKAQDWIDKHGLSRNVTFVPGDVQTASITFGDRVMTTRREQFEKEEAIKYLKKQVAGLQEDRQMLEDDKFALKETIKNLHKRKDAIQDDRNKLADTVAGLQAESQRLEGFFGTAQRENDRLAKTVAGLQAENAKLWKKAADLVMDRSQAEYQYRLDEAAKFGHPISTCPNNPDEDYLLLMAGKWVVGFNIGGKYRSYSLESQKYNCTWDDANQPTRWKPIG